MKKIIYLLISIIFTSCGSNHRIEDNKEPHFSKLQTIFIDTENYGIPYYQCDTFIIHAFDSINIIFLNQRFKNIITCSVKPFANNYDSTIIDTIYYFSLDKIDSITIYRSKQRDFVVKFINEDKRIALFNDVRPGISRGDFLERFNIQNFQSKILDIGDFEHNSYFTFYFQNDTLSRITSELYFE